jgi:hypothetical protein
MSDNMEAPAPGANPGGGRGGCNAQSGQAAHPFFRATRRGTQIHAAHLAQLQRAARIALANVADPDARATLADMVEDADRVASLCGRAAR